MTNYEYGFRNLGEEGSKSEFFIKKIGFEITSSHLTILEFKKGESYNKIKLPAHAICFLIEGRVKVSLIEDKRFELAANQMFFIPKYSEIEGEFQEDSVMFGFLFMEIEDLAMVKLLQLDPKLIDGEYDSRALVLDIKEPLAVLLEATKAYIEYGIGCERYYSIKHREILIVLRNLYTEQELLSLFSSIVTKDLDFRHKMLLAFEEYGNLEGLINASCLSRSAFMKMFKEQFNITAYQWILQQKCNKLIRFATQPGATLKEVMYSMGFDSPSHFNRFCRRHFGCTPKQFITKCQAESEQYF